MAFRQKLVADIRSYFKQCKWEETLHDQIVEVLEMRPSSPYQYIQKKISLRSKLDNTKHSSFLTELLIYCLYVNPLQTNRSQIENKILYLCVDKYQHTKIRRNEAINITQSLFLLSNCQEKQRQYFLKMISQQIQSETINVCFMAHLLYSTILFIDMKKQIDELDEKLSQIDQHINCQILNDYLESVNPANSLLKKMNVKVDSDGDLYKIIALIALQDHEN